MCSSRSGLDVRQIRQKLESLIWGKSVNSGSRRGRKGDDYVASFEPLEQRIVLSATIGNNIAVGALQQNYRLAIAATAEYTALLGGQSQALAAIQTFVSDTNAVFEKELSIHFDLVSNINTVFTNASTDGYTNGNTNAMLSENTAILDGILGNANYDIGHVFGTTGSGGSGLAGLGVVNSSLSKGRGASVSSNPQGADWLKLVAHELAHQFGADHTFNANAFASALGNRSASNAYEPASGSTLMSYAGISGADNLQTDPDSYFHSASFEQVQTYIAGAGTPNSTTPVSNSIPAVTGGSDFTIPARTPFALTASGSDADAGDSLTYTWEQLDLGPAMSLPLIDNGASPLFRSFSPSSDSTRVFPRLTDIVNNVSTAAMGEVLPTTTRAMNFRTTVRDGNSGINSDDVLISVVDTGSPFAVISPDGSENWVGGTTQTLTWDVAGTDANGINVAFVGIDLSLDGGLTYPFTLESSTPNDGSHVIVVPNIAAGNARIRIRGLGNVFFDISNNDFVITPNAAVPGFTITETGGGTLVGEDGLVGGQATDSYAIARNTSTAGTTTLVVSADGQTQVSIDNVSFASTVSIVLTSTTSAMIFVRGLDDTVQEGIHTGAITHSVTSSTDGNYPTSTLINPVTLTIADDEIQPLVGVDFDQTTSTSTPANWTKISQTFGGTTSNLIREDGITTPIGLILGVAGSAGLNTSAPSQVPFHSPPLNGIDANHLASETLSLTWTGLTPGTDYNIYLLTSENFGSNVQQDVTVTAGVTVPSFIQDTSAIGNGLLVNMGLANASKTLEADALMVQADVNGEIQIVVTDASAGGTGNALLSAAAIQEVGPSTFGFSVIQTGNSTTVSEAGTTDTFNVVLKSQPTGNVVINLSSSDLGEAMLSATELTFNDTNWNIAQTVTVTGVDDALSDGAQTSTTMLSIDTGLTLDNNFDSVGTRLLTVSTQDNEALPLVGVDFEDPTAPNDSPVNWTLIGGAFGSTTVDLINEAGNVTPFDLTIAITGGGGVAETSSPTNLPDHNPSLANIAGARFATASITLTWSGLSPGAEYDLWLFTAENFSNTVTQTVTITGGGSNPVPFTMDTTVVSGNTLLVNGAVASPTKNLQADAVRATANGSGVIQIAVVKTGGVDFALLNGAAIQEIAAIPPINADLSVTTQGNETGSVGIVYTVTLDQTNDSGVAITFDLDDLGTGTATSGIDYIAIAPGAQISVAPGASTGTFTVDVINDALEEPVETVNVQISNSSNVSVVINTASATANITDNDAPVELTLDTEDTGSTALVGGWSPSASVPGFEGANYVFARPGANATATFTPTIPTAGQYEVFVKYSSHPNRASNASVSVSHAAGSFVTSLNQKTGGGTFQSLGLFDFAGGTAGEVIVHAAGSDGFVTADAVQFVRVADIVDAPSADLASPTSGQSLTAGALNADGFIEVNFNSTVALDGATIVDAAPEFTLSGPGVGNAVIDGAGVLQSGTTYRYSFTGLFVPGDVIVNFTAGAFANTSATGNLAEQEAFTLTDGAVRITLDNTDATQVNSWAVSSAIVGYMGPNYLYTNANGAGRLVYTPTIPSDGSYEVFVNYTDGSSRASNAAYEVVSQNGTSVVRVDQRTGGGSYQSLGTYNFLAGTSGSVILRASDADGVVVGDAVQFIRVSNLTGAPTATLAGPTDGGSIVVTTINGRNYIDVTFTDTSGAGLDVSTITDPQQEFTLSGAGAAAVTVDGAATLVSGTTYRFATTGSFSPGAVDAVFAAGTFSDQASNMNIDSIASFVVTEDIQEEVIVDNNGPGFSVNDPNNEFVTSSGVNGFIGANYLAAPTGSTASATWTPTLANSGQQYQVYVRYTSHPLRATNASYVVTHDGGTTNVPVDQTTGGGTWVLLGSFTLTSGSASVQLVSAGANQYVVADAVRFVLM